MKMLWTALTCSALFAHAAFGQSTPLTLGRAVDQALQKYPAIQGAIERVAAAASAVKLARTSYLPKADFLAQVNRATHNNVFGQLLPQSVIPSITGPVLSTNSGNSVWVPR